MNYERSLELSIQYGLNRGMTFSVDQLLSVAQAMRDADPGGSNGVPIAEVATLLANVSSLHEEVMADLAATEPGHIDRWDLGKREALVAQKRELMKLLERYAR